MAEADFGSRVSGIFSDGLEGFRRQDNIFKAQAAIVAAWAVVSLLTLAVVLWSGRSENQLGATVTAEAAIGGAVLLITNTSNTTWQDITYTLNGVYLARQAILNPNDHATLPLKRFRKGGAAGKRPPRDLVPQSLGIRCEQGQFETPLSLKAGASVP